MIGNFKNILFFSLCFSWNPVFAVGLLETTTAVGIANTLEGARGSQGNPNQVINNVKDTLKKAEDSRPKLEGQEAQAPAEVAPAEATPTEANQVKTEVDTEAAKMKAETEAEASREAETERASMEAEAKETARREAEAKAKAEMTRREAGVKSEAEMVKMEVEAKAKVEMARREAGVKPEAEMAKMETGVKPDRDLAEQNTSVASVEPESHVYEEGASQDTVYDVVSERKPAEKSFKAVKTLVFYKKDCKDSTPSNCTRGNPVFTNLKSVMFDYHNNRLDFQK